MKILIVITKGDVGGAQTVVFNMAKELKNRGHTVVVGLGDGDFLINKLRDENISIKIFKSLKRTINPFKNLFFIFEINKYLDEEKFEVVHFNSSNALFGAVGVKISKNKTKTVFTFHGLSVLDSNYRNIFSKIIYWIIFKILLEFIDENIFVSYNNLEKAKKIKLVKSGYIIYNGLESNSLNFIDKDLAIKELEGKIGYALGSKLIIGSVGRLSFEKNYKFLINIFPKILEIIPNAVCILIGDGPEINNLKKRINELNLENEIFLTGEIKEAVNYFKIFNLFILPSLHEGLSISLIESIFAEVPAIASDVGGNIEVVGKNFTYSLDDEEEFFNLLKKIESGAAKQDFEKQKLLFSASKMIAKLEEIYR